MADVNMAPEAKQWLARHCTREERADVADFLQVLRRRGGLDSGDADLIKLVPDADIGSSLPKLRVSCFILPLQVSAAWRRGRTLWLGFVETTQGPLRFVGRLDLVWLSQSDPKVMGLVAAQAEMLDVAKAMYP